MKTVNDIAKFIKVEYGVDPLHLDKSVEYNNLTITKADPSLIPAGSNIDDLWEVQRKGHSIDFYRTNELKKSLDIGGSLLYYFLSERRD